MGRGHWLVAGVTGWWQGSLVGGQGSLVDVVSNVTGLIW